MPLFNFQLKQFDKCYVRQPENAEKPDMCWFWFTYASYWLNFGGQEIFRVTDKVAQKWPDDDVYLNYPLARLLEDLCEILPKVAQPLSKEVFKLVCSQQKLDTLQARLQTWLAEQEDAAGDFYASAAYCTYEKVAGFLADRNLSLMHINHGHYLFLLRYENELHFFWDLSGEDEGMPLWANAKGHYRLTWASFSEQLKNFFEQFFLAMDKQLKAVAKHYSERREQADFYLYRDKQGKQGGLDSLLAEQEQRRKTFFTCLTNLQAAEKQQTDWTEIYRCGQIILKAGQEFDV